MKDYTRVIDNIVKDIVDNEIKSLEKAPSENVTKKRTEKQECDFWKNLYEKRNYRKS